jgi:hypothetical protein
LVGEGRDVSTIGSYRSPEGEWPMEGFSIKFKGRKKFVLFGAGHFGYWNSSFEVEEMIVVKPIPNLNCYVQTEY